MTEALCLDSALTGTDSGVDVGPDLDRLIADAIVQARERPSSGWTSSPEHILQYVIRCFGYPLDPISEKIEANPYEYSRHKLRNVFGIPNTYACFDCNEPGDRWSYDYKDPGEYVRSVSGTRFSINAARYVPRCFHCQYQHEHTTGKGFDPLPIERCESTHARTVPKLFVDNYEFRFCRICGTYRRQPKKGYNARAAYPFISLSKGLLLEIQ